MIDVVTMVQTPQFWFITVLLALVLNVAGSAAWDWIKSTVAYRSTRLRARRDAQLATRSKLLREIVSSPARLHQMEFTALRTTLLEQTLLTIFGVLVSLAVLVLLALPSGSVRISLAVMCMLLTALTGTTLEKARRASRDVFELVREAHALLAEREAQATEQCDPSEREAR